MSLQPGERLGRFEIVELVGAGGMGEVYRARDPELEREVAIKVLPAEVATDPARLQRFEREARATGRLAHPNLLAIHDVGRHAGSIYLVCELLTGRSLAERLAAGPLSPRESIACAVQVADGLAAAHREGIVHRDLKPANLFLTDDGRVKILDFGLAKLTAFAAEQSQLPTIEALTEEGAVLGTVAYMAPEQVTGGSVDHRADQFALGVVLYEMLAGRRPFRGDSAPETMTAILRHDPEPLAESAPRTPAPLRWLVERCLAKDPADRYESTRDLARDLALLRDRLTDLASASEASPPGAVRARTRRRRGLLVALAVAAAAAVGALVAARWTRAEPQLHYERITFRRGTVTAARFDADGESILYSAAWDGGPRRIFLHRPGAPDPIPVGPPASELLSLSAQGEVLLLTELFSVGPFHRAGTLARMPVTGAPRILEESLAEAAFGPDGELAALVREADGQAVLEFPVGSIRLTTRGYLRDLRLSRDARRIAFVDVPHRGSDAGQIVVLDRQGGELRLGRVSGQGLAWSAAGDEIWFVRGNGIWASTLGGDERRVLDLPVKPDLCDISAAGRALISIGPRRWEMSGRPAGGEERDLSWLSWSVPFDLSADGRTILFNECATGTCRISLRSFGAESPVVLGTGFAYALSPDGEWVVSAPPWSPREVERIATQSGQRHRLEFPRFQRIGIPTWARDSRTLLFSANLPGERNRIFRLGPAETEPTPITDEGVGFGFLAVSPDGRSIAAQLLAGGIGIYSLADGALVERLPVNEDPIRWSSDGKSLFTAPLSVAPATIRRLEIASGRSEIVASLVPVDPAGVVQVSPVATTPDGEAYVYGYSRHLTDLFVVDGLD